MTMRNTGSCLFSLAFFATFSNFAQAQGYGSYGGYAAAIAQSFLVSFGIAGILLVVMLLSRRTRGAALFALLISGVLVLPAGMFFSGQGFGNQALVWGMAMLYLAPWVFVALAIIVGIVSLVRGTNSGTTTAQTSQPDPAEARPSIWPALNLMLGLVAFLYGFYPPEFLTLFEWISSFGSVRSLIYMEALKAYVPAILYVAINYVLPAFLLAVAFRRFHGELLFNPAGWGKGILLTANAVALISQVLFRFTPLLYETLGSSGGEVSLYSVWVFRYFFAIGVACLIVNQIKKNRSRGIKITEILTDYSIREKNSPLPAKSLNIGLQAFTLLKRFWPVLVGVFVMWLAEVNVEAWLRSPMRGDAFATSCLSELGPVQLKVEISPITIKTDLTETAKELEARGAQSINGLVLGLTTSDLKGSAIVTGIENGRTMPYSWLQNIRFCFQPVIAAKFVFEPVITFVPSEYSPESCEHKFVLAYQQQHIQLYQQLFSESEIETLMKNQLRQNFSNGAYFASTREGAENRANDRIRAMVKEVIDYGKSEIVRKKSAIKPAELNCPVLGEAVGNFK